jgi:hypothetical protein
MNYRISFASNPKLLLLFLFMLVLPAAAVFALLSFGIFLGVIAIALALFFEYSLIRFTINHLKSRIDTEESGIRCFTPEKEELFYHWSSITHAGSYREKRRGGGYLFIYDSSEDKLLKIPDEYSDFDRLTQEIRENTPYKELDLKEGESLEEYLKDKLKPPKRKRSKKDSDTD